MFKRVLAISAAFIIVISSFIIPSFADSTDFPIVPHVSYVDSSSVSSMLETGYNMAGRDAWVFINSSSSYYSYFTDTSFYAFAYTSGNYYEVCLACDLSSDVPTNQTLTQLLGSVTYTNNYSSHYYNGLINSTYSLVYNSTVQVLPSLLNSSIPVFSSLDSGLSAVRDFIDNGGSSGSYSDTISINPGQVAYIGFPISANYSITANTEMPKLSTGGGWSDSPQRWGASATLPESGTTFPISGSMQIPWNIVGSTNMFGQGVSAEWSVSNILATNFRFIYIYNPWYYQEGISSPSIYSSSGNLTINTNPITVEVSGYSSIRIFNLQQSVTGEGIYVSSSLSDFEDYQDVIPSSESGSGEVEYEQYTNGVSTGDPSIINNPNNNQYNPNPMTVTEHIQQVTAVLSNFANSLIELIKAPISHVAQLIQAGSGFMASLRGMYAWLPVDIQGLVTSALSLVIGIGVFKVFL